MKKIASITITSRQSVVLNALGPAALLVGLVVVNTLFDNSQTGLYPWELILAYVVTVVLHEALHGVGFAVLGVRPKFGAGMSGVMPYAYTTADRRVSLGGMFFVGMFPLTVLSILFLVLAFLFPAYQAWFVVGFLSNIGGSLGDLWIVAKLLRYRRIKNAEVLDTRIGMDVYSSVVSE